MRGLRPLGLVALLLFAAAASPPLANRRNVWMAGVARLEPADAIVVMGRGGAVTDGVLANRSLRRVLHGIGLYRHALAPWLVLSGSAQEIQARATLAGGLGGPAAPHPRAGPAAPP